MTPLLNGFIRAKSLWNRVVKGHALSIDLLPRPLPKKIWMFWAQGIEDAPDTVKLCVRSWQEKNPGWEVTVITEDTLGDYLDRSRYPATISLQHLSDMLRLEILKDQGGVWADATSYCVHPVEAWLVSWMQGGFFAFNRPTPGRVMGNWFLASEPAGYMITRLHGAANAYWANRREASNYFWFHYTFEWLLWTDTRFRKTWRNAAKMSADGPHILLHAARNDTVDQIDPESPSYKAIPVHKLSWREPLPLETLARLNLK